MCAVVRSGRFCSFLPSVFFRARFSFSVVCRIFLVCFVVLRRQLFVRRALWPQEIETYVLLPYAPLAFLI